VASKWALPHPPIGKSWGDRCAWSTAAGEAPDEPPGQPRKLLPKDTGGDTSALVPRLRRQHLGAGEKGSELTGRNPTDRGKVGTKYHLLVNANGLVLHTLLSPANTHDKIQALSDVVAECAGSLSGIHTSRPPAPRGISSQPRASRARRACRTKPSLFSSARGRHAIDHA
jgi:hypothetical protein